MLEVGILNTLLSEITLFHIFILLVFPYSLFYLLDRALPNGFDKFTHWEGALFMFSVSSIFYILSIWAFGTKGIMWFVCYIILFILFTSYLSNYLKKELKNKKLTITEHMYRIKVPITLKLKNGNKYSGALRYIDNEKIVICINKECPIILKKPKVKATKLENVHEMYFKIEDIEYYYF